jgi:hypothetical protein
MGLVRDDDRAIAGFLDAGGRDDYAKAPQRRKPDNGARHFGPRAFFVDLPD